MVGELMAHFGIGYGTINVIDPAALQTIEQLKLTQRHLRSNSTFIQSNLE